jgi:hypothetical protein
VFQRLQDAHPDLLVTGDQKTGVIGEFYSLLYAQRRYLNAQRVDYASNPSQTGWDIEVICDEPASALRIQVKTVSEYSKTRTITPLSPGWDHLYLLCLGRDLRPTGFWIVTDNDIFNGRKKLIGRRMRNPDNPRSGSQCIPWGKNQVAALWQLIEDI